MSDQRTKCPRCGECGLPVESDDPHAMTDDDGQAYHVECLSEKNEREAWAEEEFGE